MITESVLDVSQDWMAASSLQERFMENPCARAQRIVYHGRCRQMRALGGDVFHFIPLPARRVGIAIADASGKGLPAALIVANVLSSLRTAARFVPASPQAVVSAVNRQLFECSPADRYATLFYGVFDEHTRILRYVNAGHNPVMVIRPGGGVTWLEASAMPVGLFAETEFPARAIQLDAGDLLVAYTDGVVEAMNAAGEEWGAEGLLGALRACRLRPPAEIVEAAFSALDRFSGGGQADDATLLAVRIE